MIITRHFGPRTITTRQLHRWFSLILVPKCLGAQYCFVADADVFEVSGSRSGSCGVQLQHGVARYRLWSSGCRNVRGKWTETGFSRRRHGARTHRATTLRHSKPDRRRSENKVSASLSLQLVNGRHLLECFTTDGTSTNKESPVSLEASALCTRSNPTPAAAAAAANVFTRASKAVLWHSIGVHRRVRL